MNICRPYLTLDMIQTMQFLLSCKMDGEIRTFQNVYTIQPDGTEYNYEQTRHPSYITECLQGLIDSYNVTLDSAKFFLDFLKLHPYCDLNGRTGRCILMYLHNKVPFVNLDRSTYLDMIVKRDVDKVRYEINK